jgi:hypothetical protein
MKKYLNIKMEMGININILILFICAICAIYVLYVYVYSYSNYSDYSDIKRPYHPKWYEDLPETHIDVQNYYTESKKYSKMTKKYTELGYKKIKMPKNVFDYLSNAVSTTNRIKEDSNNIFARSSSGLPPYLILIPESKKIWIEKELRPIMEKWVGFPLTSVATYGPREYRKTSSLRMHVDRETHVISCILHISRSGCNGDWSLQIKGHDDITKDISMDPGDMVMYESRTCMHGRINPCPCDFYTNIFLHWMPAKSVGGLESTIVG